MADSARKRERENRTVKDARKYLTTFDPPEEKDEKKKRKVSKR